MTVTPIFDSLTLEEWHKVNKLGITSVQLDRELKLFTDNHIWVTASKECIPVREMKTSHIQNCIRCWNGQGKSEIPAGYLGGYEKWIRIFNDELANRN